MYIHTWFQYFAFDELHFPSLHCLNLHSQLLVLCRVSLILVRTDGHNLGQLIRVVLFLRQERVGG